MASRNDPPSLSNGLIQSPSLNHSSQKEPHTETPQVNPPGLPHINFLKKNYFQALERNIMRWSGDYMTVFIWQKSSDHTLMIVGIYGM